MMIFKQDSRMDSQTDRHAALQRKDICLQIYKPANNLPFSLARLWVLSLHFILWKRGPNTQQHNSTHTDMQRNTFFPIKEHAKNITNRKSHDHAAVNTFIPASLLASASPIRASRFTCAVRPMPKDLRYPWVTVQSWTERWKRKR